MVKIRSATWNWSPQLAKLLNMPFADLEHIFNAKSRPAAADDKTDDDRLIRWAKLSESVEESTYDQITKLAKKHQLTITDPHIVLNAPITSVGSKQTVM